MKIHFFTIAYNAMPWITFHYPVMRQLPFEWEWHISEGPAAPKNCTSWCHELPPGPSGDGTVNYLKTLMEIDPRVSLYQKDMWEGKIEMVNASMGQIKEPTIVWQIDADEIWKFEQMTTMRQMFMSQYPEINAAQFYCRCFVGPDLVITNRNCYGNNTDYEWRRVWVGDRGFKFLAHEPPATNLKEEWFTHRSTEMAGLVFDHYSYATVNQVAFKAHYYGYQGAVASWIRLQENKQWPAKLRDFLPWVQDGAMAERIDKAVSCIQTLA